MIKHFKKTISTLLIAAAMGTSASTLTAPQANAGIILCPFVVGIFIVLVGAAEDNLGLIILGTQNGGDELATSLQAKYPGLDTQTASDLAASINSKAKSMSPNSDGNIKVSFSSSELDSILAPSGLKASNPELYAQITADLQ